MYQRCNIDYFREMGEYTEIEDKVQGDFKFRSNFFENINRNWNYALVVPLKLKSKDLVEYLHKWILMVLN